MLKPRLKYYENSKIWICITPYPYTSRILLAYGEGATAKEAYEMWKREFDGVDLTPDQMIRKMEYSIYWK